MVSLRERVARVEEKVLSLDRLSDEKFITLGTIQKLEADKTALALAADRRAVDKAEAANEERFKSVNEFRSQLNDQAARLVTRAEHIATIDGLRAEHASDMKSMLEKFEDVKERIDKNEGKGVGLNAGWLYLLGVVAAMGTIISVVLVIQT